jgi:hypothetical protein
MDVFELVPEAKPYWLFVEPRTDENGEEIPALGYYGREIYGPHLVNLNTHEHITFDHAIEIGIVTCTHCPLSDREIESIAW